MQINKIALVIMIAMIGLGHWSARAQTNSEDRPRIGEMMPDFSLADVHFYGKTRVSNEDFKGKWLILDFWTINCGSCIASFPEVNEIQKRFKEDVKIVLVGLNGNRNTSKSDITSNRRVTSIYEKFRKKYSLELVSAYDSLLFKRWNIWTVPYVIIIDPLGKVRAITTKFNSEQIQTLLQGGNPLFIIKHTDSFDTKRLLLIDGNGGDDMEFLYRSVLVDAKPTDRFWAPNETSAFTIDIEPGIAKFQVSRVSLQALYYFAYLGSDVGIKKWALPGDPFYGIFYPHPILQVSDSSLFQYDSSTGKGLYSYSLAVPSEKITAPDSVEDTYIMEVMQRDLKNYFGYEVTLQIREMPCFKLVADEKAKRKFVTKGEETRHFYDRYKGVSFRNQPIEQLLLLYYPTSHGIPIINETGISDNIDIDLEVDNLEDFYEVRNKLSEQGLNLIVRKKKMYVMVIDDPKEKVQSFLEIISAKPHN